MRIHSDSSCSLELKALSRSLGHFFMVSQNFTKTREANGDVHIVSNIIKNVMVSAA